jgi:hypothetical protein
MARLRPLLSMQLLVAAMSLAACSTVDNAIVATENGASRIFAPDRGAPSPKPSLDPAALEWRKLSVSSSVQFAVLSGPNANPGTTAVALKVPAGEAIPAFWQDVPAAYTVMAGTFVVEGIDSLGLPQHSMHATGISARVPARMIQNMRATSAGEGLLLLTVYGEWRPNFVAESRADQTQRAAK